MISELDKEIRMRLINIILVVFILVIGSYVREVNALKINNDKTVYNDYLVSQLQVIILDDVNFKVENYSSEKIEYLVSIKDVCNNEVIDSYSDIILGEEINYYDLGNGNTCFTPVVSVK